jgi:hypothetical protein
MTFTTMKPRVMRRSDPVCAGLQRRMSHGVATVQFELSFSRQLVADLKWKVGDRIEVAVGEGSDHGYVRLKPHPGGYVLMLSGNTSGRPRIRLRYWGGETKFEQAPCECKPDVIGRALTIELPWQRRLLKAAQ